MKRLLEHQVTIEAGRDRLWALLDDTAALKRILPGCEDLEQLALNRYRAVMRTRLQFMTIRVQGTAELQDLHPPDHARVVISGRPIGIIGSFQVSVPIEVFDVEGRTRVTYAVDLQLTGRLASFGAPLLRAAVKGQVAEMIGNLLREIAADGDSAHSHSTSREGARDGLATRRFTP